MRSYNIDNYVRWKKDIEIAINRLPEVKNGDYTIYGRDQMIICFTPLVENLARKFSTSAQASGVMDITDLIQEGHAGLVQAVDRLDYKTLSESEDQEKTLKSFLSKRIRGAIRRAIDINRGDIRIPEHKLNEIRKNFGRDKKMLQDDFWIEMNAVLKVGEENIKKLLSKNNRNISFSNIISNLEEWGLISPVNESTADGINRTYSNWFLDVVTSHADKGDKSSKEYKI